MLTEVELQKYCDEVEQALAANPNCEAGVFGVLRAYTSPGWDNMITKKYVVHPELLALLCMTEETHTFWYGYIGPARQGRSGFVALIVRLASFLNADDPGNLLGSFNNRTTCFGTYYPCKIQNPDDAYAETDSFEEAARALVRMIQRFDLALRDPDFQSSHYMDQHELRIFDYLGFRRWL